MEDFKSAGFEVLRDAKGVVVTFSRSSGPGGQVSSFQLTSAEMNWADFETVLCLRVTVECE